MTLPCHGSSEKVWKAWKAMMPASHPSHTLWKSVRGSTFPRARRLDICLLDAPQARTIASARELVTDASGPQRHTCPGALSLSVLSTSVTKQTGDTVTAERDGDNPQLWASTTLLYALERELDHGSTSSVLVELSHLGCHLSRDERTGSLPGLAQSRLISPIAAKKFRTSLA